MKVVNLEEIMSVRRRPTISTIRSNAIRSYFMYHNSHTLFPSAGPMASTEHSKELEEVGSMRTPLRQNPARAGRSQRPSGWRRRRPRPRLSHKGPMPF
ncbi:apelin [Sinocyclocheilus grahami]|uniref:apelin n=1 Tax=Sinocyclocheilus grahami TaxID=75366 RepID=UPI0007AD278D|nr:PREDICTED: apelin-like [Sinocyclocheilus grahami]